MFVLFICGLKRNGHPIRHLTAVTRTWGVVAVDLVLCDMAVARLGDNDPVRVVMDVALQDGDAAVGRRWGGRRNWGQQE